MPGKSEIMRAVGEGLNSLEIDAPKGYTEWTKIVKTKLCEIGREFGFKVGAGGIRLMIFDARDQPHSEEIARGLTRMVREFNGSRAEDAWMLASWEKSDSASTNNWW